ncbi:hypothetical protein ES703_67888 [subsurface metagenome]
MGHLRNSSRIVDHRAIGINSKSYAQNREHAQSGGGYPVHSCHRVAHQGCSRHNYHRDKSREHTHSQSINYNHRRTTLSGKGEILHRLIFTGSIIFAHLTNSKTRDNTNNDSPKRTKDRVALVTHPKISHNEERSCYHESGPQISSSI